MEALRREPHGRTRFDFEVLFHFDEAFHAARGYNEGLELVHSSPAFRLHECGCSSRAVTLEYGWKSYSVDRAVLVTSPFARRKATSGSRNVLHGSSRAASVAQRVPSLAVRLRIPEPGKKCHNLLFLAGEGGLLPDEVLVVDSVTESTEADSTRYGSVAARAARLM